MTRQAAIYNQIIATSTEPSTVAQKRQQTTTNFTRRMIN